MEKENQLLPKRLSNSAYIKAKNSTYEEFVRWWDEQKPKQCNASPARTESNTVVSDVNIINMSIEDLKKKRWFPVQPSPEFTDLQIQNGINEAYKKAGDNAYFANGFEAGLKFATEQAKQPQQHTMVIKSTHKEAEKVIDYINDGLTKEPDLCQCPNDDHHYGELNLNICATCQKPIFTVINVKC